MKSFCRFSVITAMVLFVTSCTPQGTLVTGGKGGTAAIEVMPKYAQRYFANCMVYIKYSAAAPPANGIYDDSTRCTVIDSIPTAFFGNLKSGSYWIFVTEFDSFQQARSNCSAEVHITDHDTARAIIAPTL